MRITKKKKKMPIRKYNLTTNLPITFCFDSIHLHSKFNTCQINVIKISILSNVIVTRVNRYYIAWYSILLLYTNLHISAMLSVFSTIVTVIIFIVGISVIFSHYRLPIKLLHLHLYAIYLQMLSDTYSSKSFVFYKNKQNIFCLPYIDLSLF